MKEREDCQWRKRRICARASHWHSRGDQTQCMHTKPDPSENCSTAQRPSETSHGRSQISQSPSDASCSWPTSPRDVLVIPTRSVVIDDSDHSKWVRWLSAVVLTGRCHLGRDPPKRCLDKWYSPRPRERRRLCFKWLCPSVSFNPLIELRPIDYVEAKTERINHSCPGPIGWHMR